MKCLTYRGRWPLHRSTFVRAFALVLYLVGCDGPRPTASEPALFPVLVNQKLGFIDATGKVKIPPMIDDELTQSIEEHLILSHGLNLGELPLLEAGGENMQYHWFLPKDVMSSFGTDSEDEELLYIDLVLKGLRFREGRLPFRQAERWGYLAEDGSLPIAPQFDAVGPFAEGKAAVRLKDQWGFINRSGITVIPAAYVAVGSFSEGRAAVWTSESRCGYIDDSGAFVINPKYRVCLPFRDGLGAVVTEERRWGVVDERGAEVIVPQYQGLTPFVGAHAAVRFTDNRFGIVDRRGKIVVRPTYERIFPPIASGDPWLVRQGDRFGFIDLKGRVVVGPVYDMAYPFSEGIAAVRQGAKWGFITTDGRFLGNTPPQYDGVRSLTNGLAAVKMGTRWGYIDETGKIAISPKYDAVGDFEGTIAPIVISRRRGYINRSGAVIREPMDSLPLITPSMSPRDEGITGNLETDSDVRPAADWVPRTGTTHEVRMIGDAQGYRFEPANITVTTGDAVKFVFVSGGPHNVAFDGAALSADVKQQLDANISSKMAELSSAMMLNAGESVTVSFAGIPAGQYPYNCTPHLAMGMRGVITVNP